MVANNQLELLSMERGIHHLAFSYRCRGQGFTTRLSYPDTNLLALEQRVGERYMNWLALHVAAFDLNKFASLGIDTVDFGPYRDQVTAELVALWREVLHGVWAQWRYQNNRPDDSGPTLAVSPGATAPGRADLPPAIGADADQQAALAFCGGGKDTLLTLRLLEQAGIDYASLVYSHDIYGNHPEQHQLVDGLLDHCQPQRRHRLWVQDDFLGAPAEAVLVGTGLRGITAAETPFSMFASLPIALAHGYRWLVVGHEKSADTPNLVWSATGEAVNHQWGKSLAAERLLDDYIGRHLVAGLRYFSPLKPINDAVIFPALRAFEDAIPATHSCNVDKPWCYRCAKCAYVWLGFAAYLSPAAVDRSFGRNLFEDQANLGWYRQLLGLTGATPFECIGEVRESRLAFELCDRRGYDGVAMALYRHHRGRDFERPEIGDLFDIDPAAHAIPDALYARIQPILAGYAASGRQAVSAALLA